MDFGNLLLNVVYLGVTLLDVEAGNLPYRLLHELEHIIACNFLVQKRLVNLQGLVDLVHLAVPASGLLVFQELVLAFLEEDLFKRQGVPAFFQFAEPDLKFLLQEVSGAEGAEFQHFGYGQEVRLVILYDAGVRVDGNLAVRKRVESVNGLVRRFSCGQRNHYFRLLSAQVLNLADLDLALVVGGNDALENVSGILSERKLRDFQGLLVYLQDSGPDGYLSAPLSVRIAAHVHDSSGREIRIEVIFLAPEESYGSVNDLVEIVRKNLAVESYRYTVCSLVENQRKLYRQGDRLLVPSVV